MGMGRGEKYNLRNIGLRMERDFSGNGNVVMSKY